MTNSVKVTKKNMFSAMKSVFENNEFSIMVESSAKDENKNPVPVEIFSVDFIDFINHEIELLERKSTSKSRKPSEKEIENESLRADIITFLTECDTMKSISELMEEVPSLANIPGLTNQRVNALLIPLVKNGKITREYVKKKPYYSI